MTVDDLVAERIAAARRRIQQQKQDRAAFAERRNHGVAARHRIKQRRMAAANTNT